MPRGRFLTIPPALHHQLGKNRLTRQGQRKGRRKGLSRALGFKAGASQDLSKRGERVKGREVRKGERTVSFCLFPPVSARGPAAFFFPPPASDMRRGIWTSSRTSINTTPRNKNNKTRAPGVTSSPRHSSVAKTQWHPPPPTRHRGFTARLASLGRSLPWIF